MRRSGLLLPTLMLLAACDQVKEPIPPTAPGGPGGGGGDGFVRRSVLLEDFTGHRCNNCPAAANTAMQLQNTYGTNDVIIVGIHATETFASPQPGANGSYSTDFRTPAGDVYEQAFGIEWLPAGMVNRSTFNSSQLLAHQAWPSAVSQMIGLQADFDIWFSKLEHNTTANTVTAEVQVAVLAPVAGEYNLTIYLTEDHIIDWQYDAQAPDPNVPDYVHRHVLRTNLNGPWGTQIIAASANVGDTIPLSFNNFPISPAWNASNCALVAYVHATANDEVMQAVEQKFYP
jgi:hypothetical protein